MFHSSDASFVQCFVCPPLCSSTDLLVLCIIFPILCLSNSSFIQFFICLSCLAQPERKPNLRIFRSKLISHELHKCYFLYIHNLICSKVPILLYFVAPKCPSGNCYFSCFLTDKTALDRQNMLWSYLKIWEWELIFGHAVKAISSPGVHSPCL